MNTAADPVHYAWEQVPVAPAARTWTGPDPESLAARVACFREHGFVVLRANLAPAHLAELDAEVHRFCRQHRELPRVREGFSVEDPKRWPAPDQPVFRKIGGFTDFSEPFARVLRDPATLAVLTALWGPVTELYRDVLMMKQARVGREKPWHQDAVYWPYTPMEQASAMTALDPADAANGCLQVIPGSHRWGPLPHAGAELRVTLTPEQQAQTAYVPLAAGDTLVFHALLLHASEPNTSDRHRRVCIFSYMPPHLTWTGTGPRPVHPIVHDARDGR